MKKIVSLSLCALACLGLLSCEGDDNSGGKNGAAALLGVQVKDQLPLYEVAEHESMTINLSVVANPAPSEAYRVSLNANSSLVSSYNTANGTSYQMLPSEAFSFISNEVVLPRYSSKSSSCELRLRGAGCEADQTYLLPVGIDAVSGGSNYEAPAEKAAYILFKMVAQNTAGSGTQADPYLINDVESFMKIGSLLLDEGTVYFKMTEDIDFAEVVFTDIEGDNPWTPINYVKDEDLKAKARARRIVFDGNNHKISNFKAGGPLFGIMCGSIRDLTVEGAVITSDYDDGAVVIGVAGASDEPEGFRMENVKVLSSAVTNDYKRSGALIAYLRNGIVKNCEASCNVTAEQQAGGLIGRVDAGAVTDCSATGNATVDNYIVGGLIGHVGAAAIKGCSASGNVVSELGGYARAGGLIGDISGNSSIEDCHAAGNVEGKAGFYAGGLVGVIESNNTGTKEKPVYSSVDVTVSKCYATGSVTLSDSGTMAHAGGLLGSVATIACVDISNCYATGKVVCNRYSSGFVGSINAFDDVSEYLSPASKTKLAISNCYTTSDISGIIRQFGMAYTRAWSEQAKINCSGFVAKSVTDVPFCYPEDAAALSGNYYGAAGTISEQATALGWSTEIWDLSGPEPKLK